MISDLTNPIIAALVGGVFGGIVGAIATGFMSLYVNKKDRADSTEEKENRLAYAYVVQLNDYATTRKAFFERLLEEKKLKS